jgi:hypothetical protein
MAPAGKTRRTMRWALLFGPVLAMLTFGTVAWSDNVKDDVAISGTGSTRTITLGDSTVVNYFIQPTGSGGGGGPTCDAADGSTATVTINHPANVTVSPASLTFNACDQQKPVTFSATAAGTYSIPAVTITDSHGDYNVNPTAFTLQVNNPAPSDTTAPVIESTIVGTLGNDGWYTSDASLSWTITDPESPWSSSGCGTVNITADQSATSYTCSATSAGGTSSKTVSIKRDATAPVVNATPSRAPNGNGWYTAPFSVTYTGTDATSGLAGCLPDDTYSGPDTSAGSLSGSCTDKAGNSASASHAFKYDATAPSVTVSADRPADSNGWYNDTVTFSAAGTDATSEIDSCQADVVYSGPDDPAGSVTRTCADKAGNVGSGSLSFMYDATAPSVTTSLARPADHNGWYNAPVVISAVGTDATSGIDSCQSSSYSGPDSATASAIRSCTDLAGNTASDSVGFQYDATAPTLNPSVSPNPVVLNAAASAIPGASDATAGIASAACGAVDTSTVGSHSVACTATDKAGNQNSSLASYSVIYAVGGSCLGSPGHQILQPVNANWQTDLSVFKQGSTVPAKFRVCDANGVSIGTAGLVTKFALVAKLSLAGSETVDEVVISTTPDTAFRWSSTDQQWIFNMTTKTLKANTTYVYQVTLNDGSTIDFRFGLK